MASPSIIPAAPSQPFIGVFEWYVRRLLRKSFSGVRVAPGSLALLASAQQRPGPVLVLMNHSAWWDPLIGFHLHCLTAPRKPIRPGLAPMEAAQLRRFAFFRRLGVFGVDPSDPGSLRAMGEYVLGAFRAAPRTTLWITPQGEFADPRTPPRLRPGAAAIAAGWTGPAPLAVVSVSVEYAFWVDQRPEVFIRCAECPPPEGSDRPGGASTAQWRRAMTAAMRVNGERLAELVMARDPAGFEPLTAGAAGRIHPVYDLWLRLRGRAGAIEPARATASARRATPVVPGAASGVVSGVVSGGGA